MPLISSHSEGPDWATRERRRSEWEPIKILLEGDDFSKKMNTVETPNHFYLKLLEFAKTT
jgi:hypothetical protein